MRMRDAGAALAGAALLASCAPRPVPPVPAPTPPAAPQLPPEPAVAPPPAGDWRDAPLSAGDWTYDSDSGTGVAVFTHDGIGVFAVLCGHDRRFSLIRMLATAGSPLMIRTSYGERALPTQAASPGARATLSAADPLLDQIVFSRGRFLVRAEGAPDLVLPAWPEPARAIEECRDQ